MLTSTWCAASLIQLNMSLLYTILDTDEISYSIYGFWGCLRRRIARALPWQLTNWWEKHVRTVYAPQHSNLRAAIPKTWCDIDGCVEAFLFACVIDFVEGENGLKDWDEQDEKLDPIFGDVINPSNAQAAMLREVYNWAKTGRQAAEDAMHAAAPKIDVKSFFAGERYDFTAYHAIENEEIPQVGGIKQASALDLVYWWD